MSCTMRWCAAVLGTAAILGAADFTYVQKTEITGGSMKRFIDMAARFSKQAAAPQNTTHRFSGDRMSVQSATNNTVYDLANETITQIEMDKMQYSVITFTEMAQAMKNMSGKMAGAKKDNSNAAEVNWKATVDITGKTKPVAGVDTKEAVMKVFMEGRDPNQPGAVGMTEIETAMWMGTMPGYEAARDFQRKMALKMSTTMNVNPMMLGQMGSGAMRGLMEAGKKISEMDGIAMETVMRMKGSMTGPGMPPSEAGGSSQTASVPAPALPGAEEIAASTAANAGSDAGARATRGRFGGLGGQMGGALGGRLGRRAKKQEEPQEQAQTQPEKPAAAPGAGDNLALESVTTIVSFNNNPVDPSTFTVPAGFKPIEHPMKKLLK